MAELAGNLWEYNLAHIVVVDVTDDYTLMQSPLPIDLYPVLKETWLPKHGLMSLLPDVDLVEGYLYDWHESPNVSGECWYVGVVKEESARELLSQQSLVEEVENGVLPVSVPI